MVDETRRRLLEVAESNTAPNFFPNAQVVTGKLRVLRLPIGALLKWRMAILEPERTESGKVAEVRRPLSPIPEGSISSPSDAPITMARVRVRRGVGGGRVSRRAPRGAEP